ncbi:MAG: hypothetical protein KGR26_00765 [Cyanobacteria bacterium REEB65]|nr:hypothetical protein [Cyanobacteria bacterium REEB65]
MTCKSTAAEGSTTVRCACGNVEFETRGLPIGCAVCYCDTCQEGSRRIELLPKGVPVRDPDGGTAYVVYRKDRVRCIKGQDSFLKPLKLSENSATNRIVATCCDSAMVMTFDDARHWVSLYRARFGSDAPPVQLRVCTAYKAEKSDLPGDVPQYAGYSASFLLRLLVARIAMLLGR